MSRQVRDKHRTVQEQRHSVTQHSRQRDEKKVFLSGTEMVWVCEEWTEVVCRDAAFEAERHKVHHIKYITRQQ